MARRKMIGHFNPFGEYPSSVVPIFADNRGHLFAAYGRDFEPLPETAPYERHEAKALDKLRDFVPGRDCLFATSITELASFARRHEAEFFSELLRGESIGPANPQLVLSMARKARDPAALLMATQCCIAEFGTIDAFVADWYKLEHHRAESLGLSLPRHFEEVLSKMRLLRLGCSRDKVPALRRISRKFNWSSFGRGERSSSVALIPQSAQAMNEALWTGMVDAVAPEEEDSLNDLGFPVDTFNFASSRLVLAVNPESAISSSAFELTWPAILTAGLENDGFRWLKPRANTRAGMRIANALRRYFTSDEIALLEQRVDSYPSSDVQAIERAILDNTWQVDAFVAHEHSIRSLLADLPSNERAVIVVDRSPELISDQWIAVTRKVSRGEEQIFRAFCTFLSADSMRDELEGAGFEIELETTALAELEAAAKINAALEKPLAICLVIDVSGSMEGEKLDEAKVALGALVGHLNPQRGDVAGLIVFSDNVEMPVPMQHLQTNEEDLVQQIAGLKAHGRTALVEAVMRAWEELGAWPGMIRAAIVLSDGHENASSIPPETVLSVLGSIRRSERMFFGLAYGEDSDFGFLQQLSRSAGGETLRGRTESVRILFEMIAKSI
jgi:hypothetical protein